MFLALKEIRRAKARFAMLVAAIALLVFLILFQQSVQGGLITSFVGAIRNQTAPVLVYSVDGQRVIQASVITPDLQRQIESVDGIAAAAPLSQGTFSIETADGIAEASIIAYADERLGAPSELVDGRLPEAAGEAVVSEADAGDGFALGDVVTVRPGDFTIEIVGLAADAQLNAGPALFVTDATYAEALGSRNPDAAEAPPNVIALLPAEGTSPEELAERVNAVSDELDALTRSDAAAGTPGVAQVQTSFRLIFLLYGLVVPCVTGLFFLIVTVQKAGALTLLRAVGAPARRLVSALVFQALLILVAGLAIGTLLYWPVSQRRLSTVPLQFETGAVIVWWAVLIALGVGSSLLSARRVLAIDPIAATTGGGVHR